jgi:hypothetical protein
VQPVHRLMTGFCADAGKELFFARIDAVIFASRIAAGERDKPWALRHSVNIAGEAVFHKGNRERLLVR